MTEPPNRAPLDRFSHWFPPFASAPAPGSTVPAAAPEQPPAPTWLTPGDESGSIPPLRDGRGRQTFAAAGAAAAVIAVVAGVVAVSTSHSGGSPVAAADSGWCVESRDGATVVGNGPGGTSDGVAAILAFDHAYYAERSGAKARVVVAPDAPVGSADTIQGGIDSVPEGTEHCLAITETAPARYAVTLSELRPDGSTTRYEQVVTTAERDGRTYITSIGDAK
ncbi:MULTISPECIES: hypothetical protein [unclassified Rhodococcus (in: high G+C Gram-positive bacteria)]|uniref:hypothetical protein n=1 Tax=unclassified Rhodococcus (in: high G+C Gram-positive bacteria) TaxID=192944 RepID=UPI00163B0CDD|nr:MULTISPECIES: hypothetical protein [unclassified Rhodococcus (in: high G+C Gram-positive bacteria)]MBC2641120.1 hypothetical protein [Rhodococcus sp. 3A]MBC2894135.1 hypothetical protein [Rhodococcus sp. 4CII]